MVWNAKQTLWAQGTADGFEAGACRTALDAAIREAAARLGDAGGDWKYLSVRLILPGGDRYENWPLDSAKVEGPQSLESLRAERTDELAQAAKAVFAPTPTRSMRYGPRRSAFGPTIPVGAK